MSSFSWTGLEDAVLAALKAQMSGDLKTLKSYQGTWREDLKQEVWRLPAVMVTLQGSRAVQVTGASYDLTLYVRLLVIVRRLRGEEAARREEAGVYELLASIRQALWHQDLGLEILPLALVREEPLLNTPEFTVYAAHYRTGAVQDL